MPMENFESLDTHLIVNGIISFLIQLFVLVACIIIAIKRKSIATKLLLTGAILNVLGFIIRYVLNVTAARNGPEALIHTQLIISYLNNFIYALFGLGLLLFAINDLKKNH